MSAAPLALVEVLDRDGRVRRVVPVLAWPATIGRAIDNDVVIDDPHVAPYHARIDGDAIEALPSVNGVRIGRRVVGGGAGAPLPRGDAAWSIGGQRLRVRLAADALEAERPLATDPGHVGTVVLALLLWAVLIAAHWVRLDPGSRPVDWIQPLLAAPAALAAWCAAWALASKVFQQRFEFWAHLAIAVRWLFAIELVDALLGWIASTVSFELLSRLDGGIVAALAVALVADHARRVLPERRRLLAWAAIGCYVAGVALVVGLNLQRNDRVFDELYMAQLPPPPLRLAGGVPAQQFLRETEALREPLDDSARRAERDERADDAADDE